MDVSFIIPLYNGKKFIRKIISIIEENQTVMLKQGKSKKIQIIFVNDNPEENILSEDIGESEIINNIILVTNNINLGIHKTRIKGLREASGKYIVFLDQDDEIGCNYLLNQFRHIKNADAVLCNGIYRDGKMIYENENKQKEVITSGMYLNKQSVIISPGQVLIRRDSIPSEWKEFCLYANGWDDVFLWILMFKEAKIFSVNPSVDYYHIEDGNNTSFDFASEKKSLLELLEIVDKNKLLSKEDCCLLKKVAEEKFYKYDRYLEVLDNWDKIIENIINLIKEKGYSLIAIYGYGVIGKKLLECLEELNVSIEFLIDKQARAYIEIKHPIYTPENVQENVELIIITAVFDEESIKKNLSKYKSKAISLRDFC